MQIVLLGYMGSGKTTIGELLAKELRIEFIDLDRFIETEERASIQAIFEEKGEIYFRKKEAAALRRLLAQKEKFVLSIGGGTPCYANNMGAIAAHTANSFYLKVGLSELVQRLTNEKSKRPLIAGLSVEELPEFIGKHLFERSFYYNQAKHVVNCHEKNTADIISEIGVLLGQ